MAQRLTVVMVMGMMLLVARADALVLCGKGKSGVVKEGSPLKVRTTCTGKEVPIDPDATGLRGPAGAAGTNGTNGSNGANGAPGVSALQVVTQAGNAIISGYGTSTAMASCPTGKKVIGGGHDYTAYGPWNVYPWVAVSRPVTSDPQGWTTSAEGQASDDWWVTSYAVCANAAP